MCLNLAYVCWLWDGGYFDFDCWFVLLCGWLLLLVRYVCFWWYCVWFYCVWFVEFYCWFFLCYVDLLPFGVCVFDLIWLFICDFWILLLCFVWFGWFALDLLFWVYCWIGGCWFVIVLGFEYALLIWVIYVWFSRLFALICLISLGWVYLDL